MEINEIQIFDDVTLSDLFKDVYINHQVKKNEIDNLINVMQKNISSINDAAMLAPLLKEYFGVAIDNDKLLLEIAKIVQKLITTSTTQDVSTVDLLNFTAEDLEAFENKIDNHLNELTEKTIDTLKEKDFDNDVEYDKVINYDQNEAESTIET